MAEPLPEQKIHEALQELDGWTFEDGRLKRSLKFGSFKEAISFIVRVAMHAEEMNHHPDIYNSYNKLDLSLCTHDAGNKVTEKDLKLAKAIHHFNWTK